MRSMLQCRMGRHIFRTCNRSSFLFSFYYMSYIVYSWKPSALAKHTSSGTTPGAAVAEWYRYRTVACLVTSSSPVPLKTRRAGQRCTLNLSRTETSSRWCGVVVRRGGANSGVVHVA
ncbi:uncharacterized protein TNCV_2986021 [Trichonephila clavipes]|nr:uncharacterized protein TNCV_2986021 [Trichonephila clavipes]